MWLLEMKNLILVHKKDRYVFWRKEVDFWIPLMSAMRLMIVVSLTLREA